MDRPLRHPPAVNQIDSIVVLDTEAGGLDPLQYSILSVGLVSGDGQRTLEVYVAEPEIVTHPRALEVNRIDPAMVARDGLTPKAAVEAIEAFLDGMGIPRPVMCVGHNIAFDIAYMRRLYRLAGRDLPRDFSHRTVDTHTLMWALVARGKLPAHVVGSDAAFAHFDIEPPPELRHTALGDAVATRDLGAHLLELIA